jgi:hypothetical protein
MTNNEILTKYYEFCLELKVKFGMDDDCFQICLLALLETDNAKLNSLLAKNELKYWIVRVFKNNWFSKNSRYYYTYKRYYEIFKEPLEQQTDNLEDWLNEAED